MTDKFIDRDAFHRDPEPHYIVNPLVDLRQQPDRNRDRQLRYGEHFGVSERKEGWVFGSSDTAPCMGWVPSDAIAPPDNRPAPTHVVAVRQTHVYPEPDLKAPESAALTHLSRVAAGQQEGRFTETELGWIPTSHLSDECATDPVSVAEMYLGTPYLWGGNSVWGIDCSGLVQAAMIACGMDCPPDSWPQEQRLGKALPPDSALLRGDLLFWKGHVAWVCDPETILHANANDMAVAYETIEHAIKRIADQGEGPVTARKRLGGPS
ncbi:Gamma-D-glutamyl-L-lysine endopeptidase [Roseovarius litorisediminis]|uniref:Gamma-D-glutamyl-L-lysine endopeptidase n=1 Tax=Roseovarius litorisediminis TaxID=1312363 RepID=A0A1Y5SV03_9RHOB|nr:NlpC/P60 family protein [Roseovarius litorisediminis]SLN45641.1 Gamma-D-glutamyl-L-lysine endopeptidase [Roseovarius litorisediminis]